KKNQKTIIDSDGSTESISSHNFHIDPNHLVHDWTSAEYVQEFNGVTRAVAEAVVKLLDNDNTIPFIARYRKDQTRGLDADKLRLIKESYDRAKAIKHKADLVIKAIDKSGKWTPELHNHVKSVKLLSELEYIHSLYKTGSKRTLAERARELGLGPVAEAVLKGDKIPYIKSFIRSNEEGLESEDQIKDGIINILADVISKNKETFDKTKELRENISATIQTKKTKDASTGKMDSKKNDDEKYKMYYEWKNMEKNIKPHQTLAMNRAEKEKVIAIQVIVPDYLESQLKKFILQLYQSGVNASVFHKDLIHRAFDTAYKKYIKPSVIRRIRSELSEKAEEASMEVFAVNVKQLLLTQPVRGKSILGIDPGFKHGCKLAVISAQGDLLDTATIYPHCKNDKLRRGGADTLVKLVRKYGCSILALGNATACRETESFISDIINSNLLDKHKVTYTIVDESGASIYSCSDLAKTEFPDLDCNVISAVSIARRLQDPLAELVKVEPKSLGVGMYQHDLPEKQLMAKLNEVIAGLSDAKASNIINWRKGNGPFINREQLQKVKGIGAKTFEQCAGFIRIIPETALSQSAESSFMETKSKAKIKFNYLDQTWIHPESYGAASALIKACNSRPEDLGSRNFISAINVFVAGKDRAELAKQLGTNKTTLEVIVKGLRMEKGEDIRRQGSAPLFRNSLRTIDDLVVGSVLNGEVRNVTHFGAFVDIGVGTDGLIHISGLKGAVLSIGQHVEVKVANIEKERGRIGLHLNKFS
ncbi:GSCOCG00002270001-RA-CDS, partial [Cotesia congregata]